MKIGMRVEHVRHSIRNTVKVKVTRSRDVVA